MLADDRDLSLSLSVSPVSATVFAQAARDPTYRHSASAAADRATIESLQRQLAQAQQQQQQQQQQSALSKDLAALKAELESERRTSQELKVRTAAAFCLPRC